MIYSWKEKTADGRRVQKQVEIDPVRLWGEFVEWDRGEKFDGPFLRLVQCPNPEHHTIKRHFQVNIERPLVHCFAECGISGPYDRAIQMIAGCNEREARAVILRHKISRIRTESGNRKQLPSTRRLRKSVVEPDAPVLSDAELSKYSFLPRIARNYLDERKISDGSRARWELGYDESAGRITIPVRDANGTLRFVIGRTVLGAIPKYLYPDESHKSTLLYGACHLNREQVRSRGLVLVEGSIDTIILHQHEITFSVGILGATLSDRQVRLIELLDPKRVFLMFDSNGAGIKATLKAIDRLQRKFPLAICRYPQHVEDPGEFTKGEAWRSLERAISVYDFRSRLPKRNSKRKELNFA